MIRRWLARVEVEFEVYGPQDWDEFGGIIWFTWRW